MMQTVAAKEDRLDTAQRAIEALTWVRERNVTQRWKRQMTDLAVSPSGMYEQLIGILDDTSAGPCPLAFQSSSFHAISCCWPLYPITAWEVWAETFTAACAPIAVRLLMGSVLWLAAAESWTANRTMTSWGRPARKTPISSHFAWLSTQSNAFEVRKRPEEKKREAY